MTQSQDTGDAFDAVTAEITAAVFAPDVVVSQLKALLAGQSARAGLVLTDMHMDPEDGITQNVQVCLLTDTRLIAWFGGEVSEPVDENNPQGTRVMVLRSHARNVPLRTVVDVRVSQGVQHPHEAGAVASQVRVDVLTSENGGIELRSTLCEDEQCTALHGFSGYGANETIAMTAEASISGQEKVQEILAFAGAALTRLA